MFTLATLRRGGEVVVTTWVTMVSGGLGGGQSEGADNEVFYKGNPTMVLISMLNRLAVLTANPEILS